MARHIPVHNGQILAVMARTLYLGNGPRGRGKVRSEVGQEAAAEDYFS